MNDSAGLSHVVKCPTPKNDAQFIVCKSVILFTLFSEISYIFFLNDISYLRAP